MSSEETSTGGEWVRFWFGAAYLIIQAALASAAAYSSHPLTDGVLSCDGGQVLPLLIATTLGAATVSAVAARPRCWATIPESARMAALVIPGAILGLFSLVMLLVSVVGPAGSTEGSWTLDLVPLIALAPLASLFGSAVMVCFAGRVRQIGLVVWVGFVLVVATLASVARIMFGCSF